MRVPRTTVRLLILAFVSTLTLSLNLYAQTTLTAVPLITPSSKADGYVVGADNNLWLAEETANNIARITPAGVVTEFPVPTAAAQPRAMLHGPDEAMWFTEYASSKIGRITTGGSISEFSLGANRQPDAIQLGPDGAIWFTEYNSNRIGRITTAGVVTEFPQLAGANSQPSDLINGPDGNLWFCENTTGKIGRVTSAGVLTEFSTAATTSNPQSLIIGPDNNLWFVESGNNAIGRITTAGVLSEFTLSAGSLPFHIVGGLDNNLWFTEESTNKIGVMNVNGTLIAEFSVPTPASNPYVIQRGRDAALWFTENQGQKIGRISYAGVITEFPVPAPATNVGQIGTGADGNIWATSQAGNALVKVVTPGFNSPNLGAAVLPGSRSVRVGNIATAFASIVNAGTTTAHSCQVVRSFINSPIDNPLSPFSYQTTNSATNALTGIINTPADIPAGGTQSYVISISPTGPFQATDEHLGFLCLDTGAAPFIIGVNTLQLSASATAAPDVIALAAAAGGIVSIPGKTGTGAFAVSTVNVGAAGAILVTADTGAANLPIGLTLCQTNPVTAACTNPPIAAASTTITMAAGGTSTLSVFVAGNGNTVPFSPGVNRVFVRFSDQAGGGSIRGSTSVAVQSQ